MEDKDDIEVTTRDPQPKSRSPRYFLEKALVFIGAFYQDMLFGATLAWSSMFYVEWMEYFNSNKGTTAWVSSINIASIFIFGVVYSFLIGRFSCRVVGICGGLLACLAAVFSSFANGIPALCITYGFMNGFGVGMMFLSSIIIIQQHFKRRRAIAAAFAMGGASIGALVAGQLIPYLLDRYGWRGSIIIVGGLLLNGTVAGALYFPADGGSGMNCGLLSSCKRKGAKSPEEDEPETSGPIYKPKGETQGAAKGDQLLPEPKPSQKRSQKCSWLWEIFDLTLLKDPKFFLYCMGTFTFNITMNLVMQHLPSAAIFKGVMGDRDPGMLISMIGISTIPSYLITGVVGTLPFVNSVVLYGGLIIITGLVGTMMFLVDDFVSICVFSVAFGASYSAPIAIQPTAMVDLVGLDKVVKAGGINCLFMGAGCLISVPFAGFLVDSMQNYNVPYAIGGVIGIIGGIMTCLVYPLQRRRKPDGPVKGQDHRDAGDLKTTEAL